MTFAARRASSTPAVLCRSLAHAVRTGERLFLRGAREAVAFFEFGGGLRARRVGRLALRNEFGGTFVDPAHFEVGFDFTSEAVTGLGRSFLQMEAAGGKHSRKGEQDKEQASGHVNRR